MATQSTSEQFDTDERLARLHEIVVNSEKLQLEGQKLSFERLKLDAERLKMDAERPKAGVETVMLPRTMIFQAMLATAALLGAGAAIAKLLLP